MDALARELASLRENVAKMKDIVVPSKDSDSFQESLVFGSQRERDEALVEAVKAIRNGASELLLVSASNQQLRHAQEIKILTNEYVTLGLKLVMEGGDTADFRRKKLRILGLLDIFRHPQPDAESATSSDEGFFPWQPTCPPEAAAQESDSEHSENSIAVDEEEAKEDPDLDRVPVKDEPPESDSSEQLHNAEKIRNELVGASLKLAEQIETIVLMAQNIAEDDFLGVGSSSEEEIQQLAGQLAPTVKTFLQAVSQLTREKRVADGDCDSSDGDSSKKVYESALTFSLSSRDLFLRPLSVEERSLLKSQRLGFSHALLNHFSLPCELFALQVETLLESPALSSLPLVSVSPANTATLSSSPSLDSDRVKPPTSDSPFIPPLASVQANSTSALSSTGERTLKGRLSDTPPGGPTFRVCKPSRTSEGIQIMSTLGISRIQRQPAPQRRSIDVSATVLTSSASAPSLPTPASAVVAPASKAPGSNPRDLAVREVIESERTYLLSLQRCIWIFKKPMQEMAKKDPRVITEKEVVDIFSVIESIFAFSKSLIKDLQKASTTSSSVGVVFERVAPMMRLYSQYINNYNIAMDSLIECRKRPEFCAFIDGFQQQDLGFDLTSYLIQPVQRMPRYEMLLNALLRHTDPHHEEFNALSSAAKKIKEINDQINESKREAEGRSKLMKLQMVMNNKPLTLTVIGPGRRIFREGQIVRLNSKEKRESRHIYFCNNLILMVKEKGASVTNYKLHYDLPGSAKLFAAVFPDESYAPLKLLRIIENTNDNGLNESWLLSPEEAESWSLTINNVFGF